MVWEAPACARRLSAPPTPCALRPSSSPPTRFLLSCSNPSGAPYRPGLIVRYDPSASPSSGDSSTTDLLTFVNGKANWARPIKDESDEPMFAVLTMTAATDAAALAADINAAVLNNSLGELLRVGWV
jgi:hypothetical protein